MKSVKITLRDLPLHCVDNAEVLEAVSCLCTVLSPVQYGTLWHNGQPTSIRNEDRFFYVPETAVAALPMIMEIGEY